MKKKLFIFLSALILMMLFCVVASAESPDANTVDTVLTRLFEWWDINKTEILAATSWIGTVVLCIVTKRAQKKPLANIATLAGSSNRKSDDLIKSYNDLVEAYNRQSEEFAYLKNKIAELERNVLNTENIEGHIANILQTVYCNSSALPQGAKNIVSLECAECRTIVAKDRGEVIENDGQDEGADP